MFARCPLDVRWCVAELPLAMSNTARRGGLTADPQRTPSGAVLERVRRAGLVVEQLAFEVLGEPEGPHRRGHVAKPGVALGGADRERAVAHPQPGMAAQLVVGC